MIVVCASMKQFASIYVSRVRSLVNHGLGKATNAKIDPVEDGGMSSYDRVASKDIQSVKWKSCVYSRKDDRVVISFCGDYKSTPIQN